MPDSYTQLAAIFDEIGLSQSAARVVSNMLDHAQRTDRFGLNMTELGTGTGEGILTLDDAGYRLTAIDSAPKMLEIARQKSNSVNWIEADIRQMQDVLPKAQDMIVAVDVFNELGSLRELQAVFKQVYEALKEDRLFMFTFYTIEGLTKRGTSGTGVIHDDQGVFVMIENDYDYERTEATRRFVVFDQAEDGKNWQRFDAERQLRTYPIQALGALLQRVGFQQIDVFTPNFRTLTATDTEQILITAVK